MFSGITLIVVALVGFFTVADDLHHNGELFAVTGILLSGVAIYVAGRFSGAAAHLSLAWIPVSIAVGMLIGAIIDEEVVGVCVGSSFGLLLARMRRRRESSPVTAA